MRKAMVVLGFVTALCSTSSPGVADDTGAAGGAVAGAVVGAVVGGPVGAVIGAAVGGVVGGAATGRTRWRRSGTSNLHLLPTSADWFSVSPQGVRV
jgi:phage tail tape-measure protein